jgi:hypothetical protein
VQEHPTEESGAPSYAVIDQRSDVPLLTLGADTRYPIDPHFWFSEDGRALAWSHVDGAVVLADLEQVNRRLALFGFGWTEEGR